MLSGIHSPFLSDPAIILLATDLSKGGAMELNAKILWGACADDGMDAGITIRTILDPLAGPGAPVKPAVYSGGVYQTDRRWFGEGNAREPVDVVVVDNVPSQANRLEAALQRLRQELGLPEIVLDLSGSPLPPHLPKSLSSFRFPHRQADAYLRDAQLDGQPFEKTDTGRALMSATADNAEALLQWFPQALLFGFWQSHLGKKRTQAKLARSWVSEVIGYRPATTDTRMEGLKGDPLNLSVEEAVQFDEDTADWELLEGSKKAGDGKKKEKLSEIGHGQVPVLSEKRALGAVSFDVISQVATVSFASLRRVWLAEGDVNAAARALLVCLGLVGHAAAFGASFSLRSGCDLRQISSSWTWLGSKGDEAIEPMNLDAAIELFRRAVAQAELAGLPVGSHWASEPLVLKPLDNLVKVIERSWPSVD